MRSSEVSERTSGGRDRPNERKPGWTGWQREFAGSVGLAVQGPRPPEPHFAAACPSSLLAAVGQHLQSPRAEKGRMRRAHGRLELNLEARGSRLQPTVPSTFLIAFLFPASASPGAVHHSGGAARYLACHTILGTSRHSVGIPESIPCIVWYRLGEEMHYRLRVDGICFEKEETGNRPGRHAVAWRTTTIT
ncbi:hypothetical protein CSOJ01_05457 [Colletotrichum sojae]|uniref:Uncharacterized protein n=1 Tax=Colletotrichum sojae TaxID=2175907 RepID=A0A8H6JFW6_9PEZI|nr:hypothetical protein CSOJ01_05457 [Colletotrichum sojae]